MTTRKRGAAGNQPAALQSTGRQANEPAFHSALAAQEATPGLAEAPSFHKRPVTLLRPSGKRLELTGLAGPVALTLIAAGQRGICQPDVQPWCWDLAATIRDLRGLLGNEAIATLRGDRRSRLPARYRLLEQLSVPPERGE